MIPYKSGLVHDVYKKDDYIIKVAKENFPDFNSKDHFELEVNSLRLLNLHGVPTPHETEVWKSEGSLSYKFGIKESFVEGKQLEWKDLHDCHLNTMIDLFNKAHHIDLDKFGYLNEKMTGNCYKWKDFLISFISPFLSVFRKGNGFKKYISQVVNNIENLEFSGSGKFLFVDLNPGNMIFSQNDILAAVIDIDHPYSGDPLYDFASVNWYSPDTFQRLLKITRITQIQIKTIKLYTIIHGMNVVLWMKRHNLDVTKEIDKLNNFLISVPVS